MFAYRWSAQGKYFARLGEDSISIYETPVSCQLLMYRSCLLVNMEILFTILHTFLIVYFGENNYCCDCQDNRQYSYFLTALGQVPFEQEYMYETDTLLKIHRKFYGGVTRKPFQNAARL